MLSDLSKVTQLAGQWQGSGTEPQVPTTPKPASCSPPPQPGKENTILPASQFCLGHHSSTRRSPFKKQREQLTPKAGGAGSHELSSGHPCPTPFPRHPHGTEQDGQPPRALACAEGPHTWRSLTHLPESSPASVGQQLRSRLSEARGLGAQPSSGRPCKTRNPSGL